MDEASRHSRHQAAITNPYCYFESLASELLFAILTQLPNLEALGNVLEASPAAYRLFDVQGVEIFETILSSDFTTHKYTRALIRIVVLLRTTALPPHVHDFISFKDLIRHETTPYRYEPSRWVHPPSNLPVYTSTAALREVLVTNQKIRRLTVDCLQYYLDRFKPLKPSCLTDKKFRYQSKYGDDDHYIGPWRLMPAVIPYPVQDVGVPSWIEQQRVLRALWRVRLFYEFKNAIGASCITWTENDISRIHWMKMEELYDAPSFIYSDTDGCGYSLVGRDPQANYMDNLLEHELIRSIVDFLQEDKNPMSESTYQKLKVEWATSPPPASSKEWEYETVDDCHNSPMWRFFYDLAGDTPGLVGQHNFDTLSPLQHVDFIPFRHLGFAIWSQARLQGYGFLPRPLPLFAEEGFVRMSEFAPVYAAWRSVLAPHERAEVERKNKWWEDESMAASATNPVGNQLQQVSMFSSMDMEEEEEEMGPPLLDWKRHFLRQKRRFFSGIEEEDEEDDESDVENYEMSPRAAPAAGL